MQHPVLIIISVIISIFAIFLIIIYSVKRNFRSFPCYFNILFTLIIAVDNLIRLMPGGKGNGIGDEKPKEIECHIQAIALTLFDKLMLCFMTVYSIIAYIGSFQMFFYKSYEKLIFIVLTIISFIISLVCTFIFYFNGISNRSQFCYVETKNNIKKIVDSIITSILLIISLFCITKLLIKIYLLKKEKENDTDNEHTNGKGMNFHFLRFMISFFINLFTFGYVIILINKIFDMETFVKDLIYILLSLFAELFFTINNELIKEVKKILTCRTTRENDESEDNNQRNTEISENLNEEEYDNYITEA